MTTVEEPKTEDKRRVELLSDLRMLLNWLEANPDVPLPRYGVEISVHVGHDNDEDGIRLVREAAKHAGVDVTRSAGGAHHHANKRFGMAAYQAIYVERDHMADYDRRQEIARKLTAEDLAEAAPEHCVCCTDDCGDRRGHVPVIDVAPDSLGFITHVERCNCGAGLPCDKAEARHG